MNKVGYTSLVRHMALTATAKYSRLSPKKHPAVLLLPPGRVIFYIETIHRIS